MNNLTSPFDDCLAMAAQAEDATMAVPILIDGNAARGVVDVLDSNHARKVGMDVTNYNASVFLSRETFEATSPHTESIITVGTSRLRVMRIADMGGAGVELLCEQPNQRRVTVPGF